MGELPARPRGRAIAWACAALSSGCFTANRYDAPRTLPAGTWALLAADEASLARVRDDHPGEPFPDRVKSHAGWPILPFTFGARYGFLDRLDGGAYLRQGATLGADVKVSLVRGPFDLSVAAGGQGTIGFGLLDAPVPLGVHLGDHVVLYAAPGVAYAWGKATSRNEILPRAGALGRGTLGVAIAVVKGATIVPEVTVMRSFDASSLWVTGGLGVRAEGP